MLLGVELVQPHQPRTDGGDPRLVAQPGRVGGVGADAADEARLRNEARAAAVRAGLVRLEEMDAEQHTDLEDEAIDTLRLSLQTRLDRYERRLSLLQFAEGGEIPVSPEYEAALQVRKTVLDAEREELLRWRDVGRLPDASLRILQRELDHAEGLLPTRPA